MISILCRSLRTVGRWSLPSIYELEPDYPSLVSNESFNLSETRGNRYSRRTGVATIKQGMTGIWDKWGVRHPLTVLQVDRCQVIQVKTKQNDGYFALQLGVGTRSMKKVTKPLVGHYIKANVPPKQKLLECRISQDCVLPLGYQLHASHFIPGQLVDVRGTSKGKGFQGVIKRWHFSRQPASHGNTKTTRAVGSTGQRQDPGRVFPGKKMPGHLGNKNATTQNLKIYKIDYQRDLIYVIGAVPGCIGGVVRIVDAVKEPKQYKRLSHPTRVDIRELPDEEEMDVGTDYYEQVFLHDNAVPKVKEEEDPAEKTRALEEG